MQYIFYILLGLLPSLIWLSFYLKKDKHPESNSIVLRVFIWGMLIAPLAIIFELILIWLLNPSSNPLDLLSQTYQASFIKIILAATLIPALVEEYLKYSIVRHRFLRKPEFDEPVDAMLYCIIAGLGFAAIENLLILFKIPFPEIGRAFTIIGFRFLGATLVHALASGIAGYWLARGLLHLKKRKRFILTGLTIAIIFHSCYNYLVITILNQETHNQKLFFISVVAVLLISAAFLVSYYFKKLKKQQSICQTN
ncbi:MAG: PrsW family intramembrane metalloprotease [Candidatus Portnoybacteria bacterium]|nr:PrsW family intramembrane metalloprotease [Candidatus Portnoybacteria bacterium]